MSQVLAHAWPGNVRELENAMHRAVLLVQRRRCRRRRHPRCRMARRSGSRRDDLGAAIEAGQAAARALVGRTVADVEQDLILETLTHCLGNRTHAAHILGISIRTLRNKLKLYSDAGVRGAAAANRTGGLNARMVDAAQPQRPTRSRSATFAASSCAARSRSPWACSAFWRSCWCRCRPYLARRAAGDLDHVLDPGADDGAVDQEAARIHRLSRRCCCWRRCCGLRSTSPPRG